MRMQRIVPLLIIIVASVHWTFAQTKPMQNDDVIQMTKAGFDEETIIKAVEANDCAFNVTVEALISLKDAGVSQKVISAMLKREGQNKNRTTPTNENPNPPSPSPDPRLLDKERASTSKDSPFPPIYVEEVSSEGGTAASSDTTLEAIKTLQKAGMTVTTHKDKAHYILLITRQLGKKSWKKDTKVALSDRDGKVVYANSTRTVGGGLDDIVDYVRKHHE